MSVAFPLDGALGVNTSGVVTAASSPSKPMSSIAADSFPAHSLAFKLSDDASGKIPLSRCAPSLRQRASRTARRRKGLRHGPTLHPHPPKMGRAHLKTTTEATATIQRRRAARQRKNTAPDLKIQVGGHPRSTRCSSMDSTHMARNGKKLLSSSRLAQWCKSALMPKNTFRKWPRHASRPMRRFLPHFEARRC